MRVSHVNDGQECALVLVAMSPHRSHHVDVDAGVDYIRQTNATPLHVETLLDCGDSRLARHVIECLRLVLVCELIVAFEFGG